MQPTVSYFDIKQALVIRNPHQQNKHKTRYVKFQLPRPLTYTSWTVRFASKVGQIGPKWDKSGTFHIRFQYIWHGAPNVLKSDMKSPGFVPFRANLTPIGPKSTILAVADNARL